MDDQNQETLLARQTLLQHKLLVVKDTGLAAVSILALANLSLLVLGFALDWPFLLLNTFMKGLLFALMSLVITYVLANIDCVAPQLSEKMSAALRMFLLLATPLGSAALLFSGVWMAITLP